jgi:hypothetical protein
MSDQEEKKKAEATGLHDRIHKEDFQFVLKALLAAYQPILDEAVKLAKDPERLKKEAEGKRPSCEEEFAMAKRILEKFLTREVALRLIPEKHRQELGPVESWQWCLDHILCCVIFGWLFCRGFRTFRVSVQYMYRYWICVRQALGTPVADPPTEEQRRDFQTLVQALAEAYKPYLTDQLATVEFPAGLPGEVLAGKINCLEGKADAGAVFRRFLNADTAQAVLGKEAFAAHSKEPSFRFCRCFCLCAIDFGCCLASVVSLTDLIWCLLDFFQCLEDCFQPLICDITEPAPNSCAEAKFVVPCAPLIGVEIIGTAAGLSFDHYTLQYSWGGGTPLNDAVVYPNCNRPPGQTSSNVPVFGGTLGYLDVTLLPAGVAEFTVYVDVFDSGAGHIQCTQTFKLRTTAIEIQAAAKVNALVAEDPFNLGSFTKLIKATNNPNPAVPELSIGGAFSVDGSAYTVGCDRIISQFVLVFFSVNPAVPVPAFPDATGGTQLVPTQPVPYDDIPGHPWQSGCFPVITPNIILNGDLVATWATLNCTFLNINYTVPKVLPVPFWDSSLLNGRFVILLEVRDRALPAGAFPGSVAGVDQVAVWIDNQVPIAQIKSIGGISGCGDLHLKDYVGTTAEILGVAWDPPIVGLVPPKKPDDNFGSYSMGFEKNGDPLASGGIPPATPNTRVPNIWPGPLGGALGTLANWDIVAALDGGAGPLPLHSPKLVRGDRCAYVVTLTVSDTTHVGDSGTVHTTGPVLYAINVINDIT